MAPVFFFREEDAEYKELSQWFKCTFTVPASSLDYLHTTMAHASPTLAFSSAEQYMMYSKAAFFNDPATAAAILRTSLAAQAKGLGRQVAGSSTRPAGTPLRRGGRRAREPGQVRAGAALPRGVDGHGGARAARGVAV